ncbi:M10 family metallopeptidase C-terminal domain-containing protein [Vulcanococcus sp. Clear-D1]|jgi:Ca2+-binding RTX toxin-like protein|uniref:M10 family metallopeptidase C-terminal domain-containing protein n=1 Tax=Vulcanococcus sp. Clear-D1 TaxID=2766970 RepID=UPI0019B29AFB|nr:M10 family metallopeptidase C-terminal domain-containing protein [Vulcanococcus sp. Clear-D1]MBD1194234.1 M10 family metallopeptidase C-terminal domain-containing protein [Vulcanococcus sp. Clear-D1]
MYSYRHSLSRIKGFILANLIFNPSRSTDYSADTMRNGISRFRNESPADTDELVVDQYMRNDTLEVNFDMGTGTYTETAYLNGVSQSSTYRMNGFEEYLPLVSRVVRHSITGTDAGNRIATGNGNDSIWGKGGDDVLLGGGGRDYLHGGDHDDILIGGIGADALIGGSGYDTFVLSSLSGGTDTIRDFQPGFDKIDISSVAPGISLVPHGSGRSGYTEILDGYRNVVGRIEGWAGPGLVVTHDFIL